MYTINANLLVCASQKLETGDAVELYSQVHSNVYTWAATVCLGLATTPVVTDVHFLPTYIC